MKNEDGGNNLKIGILGCGAIGSGIADSIHCNPPREAKLVGVYDIDRERSGNVAKKCSDPGLAANSFEELIQRADLIIEAVNSDHTLELISQIIDQKKHVFVMSVGRLLGDPNLFDTARAKGVHMVIPSGAIAGIDSLKAARIVGIDQITLTTYKSPRSLKGAPFLQAKGISLDNITSATTIFEGSVIDATKAFPQNINVAATLALATGTIEKLKIRIVTSPEFKYNCHEVIAKGPFGEIKTMTKNTLCPDNPKTSYLAVLSGIATLNAFCDNIKIGT